MNNDEFTSILSDFDIVLLLETWCGEHSTFELEGYKYFNFNRKNQQKNARRNSGGVAMFYSLDIVECVKVIRKHFDTMIWVKLDKVLLNRDEDIYLCSAYV